MVTGPQMHFLKHFCEETLYKKWSFPLRIFLLNVTKSAGNCGLATFTEEILNRKLHFLCSENKQAVVSNITKIVVFFFNGILYIQSSNIGRSLFWQRSTYKWIYGIKKRSFNPSSVHFFPTIVSVQRGWGCNLFYYSNRTGELGINPPPLVSQLLEGMNLKSISGIPLVEW